MQNVRININIGVKFKGIWVILNMWDFRRPVWERTWWAAWVTWHPMHVRLHKSAQKPCQVGIMKNRMSAPCCYVALLLRQGKPLIVDDAIAICNCGGVKCVDINRAPRCCKNGLPGLKLFVSRLTGIYFRICAWRAHIATAVSEIFIQIG